MATKAGNRSGWPLEEWNVIHAQSCQVSRAGVVAPRANISVVPISDTSPEARAKQDEILRAMPGEQRMMLAYEMSMFARELAKEGIRRDHPDWSDAQIARELLRLAFLPAPLPDWLR
jgi:hypothetical protein